MHLKNCMVTLSKVNVKLRLALADIKTQGCAWVHLCVRVCARFLNVCPCLLCARLSVVMMHIFREVADCVPPA